MSAADDAILACARDVEALALTAKCNECGGAGDVQRGSMLHGDVWTDPCPRCDGSGLDSHMARALRGLKFKWLRNADLLERYLAEKYHDGTESP